MESQLSQADTIYTLISMYWYFYVKFSQIQSINFFPVLISFDLTRNLQPKYVLSFIGHQVIIECLFKRNNVLCVVVVFWILYMFLWKRQWIHQTLIKEKILNALLFLKETWLNGKPYLISEWQSYQRRTVRGVLKITYGNLRNVHIHLNTRVMLDFFVSWVCQTRSLPCCLCTVENECGRKIFTSTISYFGGWN